MSANAAAEHSTERASKREPADESVFEAFGKVVDASGLGACVSVASIAVGAVSFVTGGPLAALAVYGAYGLLASGAAAVFGLAGMEFSSRD